MIKRICDRCGETCGSLFDIAVPTKNSTCLGVLRVRKEVCKECYKRYTELSNASRDIEVLMFRDFMKGANNE